MRSQPPFRATVLIGLVLWLAVWNGLRAWTALAWRARLTEFAPWPGPYYIAGSGILWAGLGLFVLWSMRRGKRWTKGVYAATALAYTTWYWTDRLLFQQARPNWPFVLAANVILLIFIAFALRSNIFPERGS